MDNTCKVVLCVLGRERPGFDQQWAQKMTAGAVSYLSEQANTPSPSDTQGRARGLASLPRPARPRYSFTNYHDTLRTPAQAAAALRSPEVRGADVLILLQPSIADGRLIDALSLAPAELPMIFWATPERGNTEQISSNSLVGTHLFAATLRQYGRRHGFVYGPPDSPDLRRDLTTAIAVAYTVRTLRRARVGLVGDHAPGFIDLHVDPRFMHRRIGTAVEHIAFEQFTTLVRELSERPSDHPALENQSLDDIAETLRALELPQKDIADQQGMFFQQAVFTAAYQYLYSNRTLDAIAVRCWPEVPALFGQWPYFAISYLQSIGMPIAIEGDIDGAIDMLITLRLGHGNCYLTDWLSHTQRTATLWHGGAIPLQLCLPHAHARDPVPRVSPRPPRWSCYHYPFQQSPPGSNSRHGTPRRYARHPVPSLVLRRHLLLHRPGGTHRRAPPAPTGHHLSNRDRQRRIRHRGRRRRRYHQMVPVHAPPRYAPSPDPGTHSHRRRTCRG